MHQHQKKAAVGRIHVGLFLVCSAVDFLNHLNCAASEQQAEERLCLSVAERVAAAGLSCPTFACGFLEGLSVPRATTVSPCIGCVCPLCTAVIVCGAVACFGTPSLSSRDAPAGSVQVSSPGSVQTIALQTGSCHQRCDFWLCHANKEAM